MLQEEAEYATILRRAIMVGSGRLISMAGVQPADEMKMGPVCFTFQPERRAQAHFVQGSRPDFTARRDDMLQKI